MKTRWHVHRTVRAQSDGERRWDYAYQFLLQWTMDHDAGASPASGYPQEEPYGSRSVCPCFNNPPTANSDDCSTARTSARPRRDPA